MSLNELLNDVLAKRDQIVGAEAEVAAARERAREALGDWSPEIEPTATHGYEKITNPHDSDTSLLFSEIDLTLTQLLWDFGATNGTVEKARLELIERQLNLAKVHDDIFVEAANAYVDLIRAHQVLNFSRQSQDNVRQQTGLEEARVETGSGRSAGGDTPHEDTALGLSRVQSEPRIRGSRTAPLLDQLGEDRSQQIDWDEQVAGRRISLGSRIVDEQRPWLCKNAEEVKFR